MHDCFSRDQFEEAERFGRHVVELGPTRWLNLSGDAMDDLNFGGILAGGLIHP